MGCSDICLGHRQRRCIFSTWGKTIEVTDVVTPTNANFIRYRAPNKNQCKECHLKDDAVEPIGPKPRNINKAIAYENGIKNNQIDHWAALGLLEEKPYSNDLMVDAFNDNHDINLRARSYLDINCGHCHSPEGSASSSGLYLSIDDKQFGVFKKACRCRKRKWRLELFNCSWTSRGIHTSISNAFK